MEQSEILQYLAELTGIEGHAFHRAILLEVVVWFVMIAAVIIDFSTGIRKALDNLWSLEFAPAP